MANESGKTMNKAHWSERLKQSHKKMADYFATYGEKTGLGGSALLLMGGGAMMMGSATSNSPEAAAVAGTAAGAMVVAGVLKAGGMSVSQAMAQKHLKGAEHLLEPAGTPRAKGATAIDDDLVRSDPSFQKAMASAFQQLQDDPETRSEFHQMIQNSPTARRALMNAQRQIDAATEMREQAGQAQADSESEDTGPSMTYH